MSCKSVCKYVQASTFPGYTDLLTGPNPEVVRNYGAVAHGSTILGKIAQVADSVFEDVEVHQVATVEFSKTRAEVLTSNIGVLSPNSSGPHVLQGRYGDREESVPKTMNII